MNRLIRERLLEQLPQMLAIELVKNVRDLLVLLGQLLELAGKMRKRVLVAFALHGLPALRVFVHLVQEPVPRGFLLAELLHVHPGAITFDLRRITGLAAPLPDHLQRYLAEQIAIVRIVRAVPHGLDQIRPPVLLHVPGLFFHPQLIGPVLIEGHPVLAEILHVVHERVPLIVWNGGQPGLQVRLFLHGLGHVDSDPLARLV